MRSLHHPGLQRSISLLLASLLLACEAPVTGPDGAQVPAGPISPQASVAPPPVLSAVTSAVHIGPVVRITTDPAEQRSPQIWGDLVVWQDSRRGNWDIYAFDLGTGMEFPISTAPDDQTHPDIWDGVVVWQDHRNGNWDIYGHPDGRDVRRSWRPR